MTIKSFVLIISRPLTSHFEDYFNLPPKNSRFLRLEFGNSSPDIIGIGIFAGRYSLDFEAGGFPKHFLVLRHQDQEGGDRAEA